MHRSVKMGQNNDILTTATYDVRSILAFTAAAGRVHKIVQCSLQCTSTVHCTALHTRARPEFEGVSTCRRSTDGKIRALCTGVVRTYPPYLPYLLRRIFATFAMLLSPRNHFLSCRWTKDLEVRDISPFLCCESASPTRKITPFCRSWTKVQSGHSFKKSMESRTVLSLASSRSERRLWPK